MGFRFAVGERVRIKPKNEMQERNRFPGWHQDMDTSCGKEATIRSLKLDTGELCYRFEGIPFQFREDWLEPIGGPSLLDQPFHDAAAKKRDDIFRQML